MAIPKKELESSLEFEQRKQIQENYEYHLYLENEYNEYVNDDESVDFFAALSEALKHVEYQKSVLHGDGLLAKLQKDYEDEKSDVRRIIYNLNKVFNSPASASLSGEAGMMDEHEGGSVIHRKTYKKYKRINKRRNTKRKKL